MTKINLDLRYPRIRYKMLEVIKKFALHASKANFFIIISIRNTREMIIVKYKTMGQKTSGKCPL